MGRGLDRRTGSYGTLANSSSHTESSWHLKGFTEGAVTIGVGSLFQYFTTRVEKDDFLRRCRLGFAERCDEFSETIYILLNHFIKHLFHGLEVQAHFLFLKWCRRCIMLGAPKNIVGGTKQKCGKDLSTSTQNSVSFFLE